MREPIERMRKLVNDNLVMGLRFQMNGELNKLDSEIEQELNSRAEQTCRNERAEFGKFRCSECWTQVDAISTNTTQPMPIKYCPNCSAKVVR